MRCALPALLLFGCGDLGFDVVGERATALDALFHQEPRWLGGDGAYTIDLGGDRTLWLFGDSFVATSPANVRTESTMVRNSIAVMTGRDLATATMQFAWRDGATPTSFFPEASDHWFWPSDGVRVPGGPLVVFLSEQSATPGDGLGFAGAGLRAVRIANPDAPVASWTLELTAAHAPDYAPDANVACSTIADDHLVAVVTDGETHHGRLARWPLAVVTGGDLAIPEWWSGTVWATETELAGAPAIVIDDGATECSLAYDATAAGYVYTATDGFGATPIAMRFAAELTGPYSNATDVFTPPESSAPNAFVYAAKSHPSLTATGDSGAAWQVVTYADNSFTFGDLFDAARAGVLYWPHVALFYYRTR